MAPRSAADARELHAWAGREFAPVVLTLSDSLVDDACHANGIEFQQLLRPFSHIGHIDRPTRTSSDTSHRLGELHIRIRSPTECEPISPDTADSHLLDVLRPWANHACEQHYSLDSAPSIECVRDRVNAPDGPGPPWYDDYEAHLEECLAVSDHDAVDHPVAAILAASAGCEDPVFSLTELWSTSNLPSVLRDGKADPNVLQHYVLVVDSRYQEQEDGVESMHKNMCDAFGEGKCSVLRMNSAPSPAGNEGENELQSSLSDSYRKRFESAQLYGPRPSPFVAAQAKEKSSTSGCNGDTECDGEGPFYACMTDHDVQRVCTFMSSFVVHSLVPLMEHRVRAFSQSVQSTRRSFRNQFFGMMSRTSSTTADKTGAVLSASQVSQIRLAGDLALMLGDYELAESHLKLLVNDSRYEKSWQRLAAAEETLGCIAALKDSKDLRASQQHFDTAYTYYQKAGLAGSSDPKQADDLMLATRAMMRSTRAMMRCSRIHCLKGQWRDATAPLIRASHERNHPRAAILLSRAALCYLRGHKQSSYPRKFAFYQILAGHRYHHAGMRGLAIWAYLDVLQVYLCSGWADVEEHLFFTLARQIANNSDWEGAAQFYVELLQRAHAQAKPQNQESYLEELVYCVNKAQAGREESLVYEQLPLPQFDERGLHVNFHGKRCYDSQKAKIIDEDEWRPLEDAILPSGLSRATGSTWLDNAQEAEEQLNTSVAGETIELELPVMNPLWATLNLEDVQLDYSFEPEPEMHSRKGVDLMRTRLSLGPRARSHLLLQVRPDEPGMLRVHGIRWTLNDVVHGRRRLKVPAPFTRRVGKGWQKDFVLEKRLAFSVEAALPLLSARILNKPEFMHEKSLAQCSIEVCNKSNVPYDSLHIAISSPHVTAGSALSQKSEQTGLDETPPESYEEVDGNCSGVYSLFRQDSMHSMHVGRQEWPLWLWAESTDCFQVVKLVLLATSLDSNNRRRHRTFRLTFSVPVEPLLVASATLVPSDRRPKGRTLQVKARNVSGSVQSSATLRYLCLLRERGQDAEPLSKGMEMSLRQGDEWTLHIVLRKDEDERYQSKSGRNWITLSLDDGKMKDLGALDVSHAGLQTRLQQLAGSCDTLVLWHDGHCFGATPIVTARDGERLVPYLLKAPSEAKHDLSQGPCVVSVSVLVVNHTGIAVDGARVEAFKEVPDASRPKWMWCGHCVHSLGRMEIGEEREVAFTACLFVEGLYQLSTIFASSSYADWMYTECAPMLIKLVDISQCS